MKALIKMESDWRLAKNGLFLTGSASELMISIFRV